LENFETLLGLDGVGARTLREGRRVKRLSRLAKTTEPVRGF
jgi:hypothetical protein